MGIPQTNKTTLQVTTESALGTPGTTYYMLEPNPGTLNPFGKSLQKQARSPMSKKRRRRKGSTVGATSAVGFTHDATLSLFRRFLDGFMFCSFSTLQGTALFTPTAAVDGGASSDSFTVAAGGDLAQNTLIVSRGFATAQNNGLWVVDASSTATSIKVPTGSLVAEASPPSNAEVAVCGVAGAAGDLEIDANGDLISTTLDFTTLGLTVGQSIYLPDVGSTYGFVLSGNEGFARVTAIAAHTLTLAKRGQAFQTDDGTDTGSGGTAKQIYVYFGRFLRDVDVDDADYLERSHTFEATWTDLSGGTTDEYEYAKGNYCNEMTFQMQPGQLATVQLGFVGTTSVAPSTSRLSGASSGIEPNATAAMGPTSDIMRMRVQQSDETGITTYVRNANLSLKNGIDPEVVLGTEGAAFLNVGNFEIDLTGTALFTSDAVISSLLANDTVGVDFAIRSTDGGILVDIPSATIEDGARGLEANKSVTVNMNLQAHEDATLGYSVGISEFPYLP